jgi:hypothetical protein
VTKKALTADLVPLFCARCGAELKQGADIFYRIHIEAIADETAPVISQKDLERDIRKEIERLIAQLQKLPLQEAMDQVYRRLTIHLCGPCYRPWIENPAG